MENQHKEHHGGGFANGFLLGVIVGAAVVFLLATKKGKRILKMLTENGFEGVAELTDMFADDEEEMEEEEYTAEGADEKLVPKTALKPIKRFFRGVKR